MPSRLPRFSHTATDGLGEPVMSDASERWRYGLFAVIAGFMAVIVCLGLVVVRYASPKDAITVAAPAITAIGALAGAYFGVQAGSAGRAESDAARDEAQRLALTFAAVAEPDAALYVLGLPPRLNPGDGGGPAAGGTVPSNGSSRADDLHGQAMMGTDTETDELTGDPGSGSGQPSSTRKAEPVMDAQERALGF